MKGKNLSDLSCENCNYNTSSKKDFDKHLSTRKHMRLHSGNKIEYICKKCDYNTSIMQNYEKHLLTRKHAKMKNTKKMENNIGIIPNNKNCCNYPLPYVSYICEPCEYSSGDKTNYAKHCLTKKHIRNHPSKIASELPHDDASDTITIDKTILLELLKQGNDFKQMFVDHIKQTDDFKSIIIDQNNKFALSAKGNTIITNTNCNNHFNLNFFLNEQCKDAMNINEFIESIEIGIDDLEYVGKHGYINGITKIVTNNLTQLGVYKRPIHCSDLKREIIHIKDEDQWKKDNETHEMTNKMIEKVTYKNLKLVSPWQKQHPKCEVLDSPEYNLWWNIAKQSNGGTDIHKNVNQVLKNITKSVYIDKTDIV